MVKAPGIRRPATPVKGRRVSATRGARVLVALAVAALTLAGCSSRGTPVSDSTRAVAVAGASSGPFQGVASLPRTVSGATLDTAALHGHPVVLWFWAPWCAICKGEAPTVAKVAAEYVGRVTFVGVGGQSSISDMKAFVTQTGTGSLAQLADVNGAVWRRFGVTAQPAFAFITSTGRANLVLGGIDERSFRARLAQLTAGQPGLAPGTGRSCTSGASHKPGSLDCGSAGPAHTSGAPTGPTMTTR